MIFDVKDPKQPVMIHAIRICKPVKHVRLQLDFVKQMDLDPDRNTLICRSKLGQVTVVQIINRTMLKSQIIATISSYPNIS